MTKSLRTAAIQWEKKLEIEKAKVVEAFCALGEFRVLMAEYNTDTYLAGIIDYRAKVQALFLGLDITWLDVEGSDEVKVDGSTMAEEAPTKVVTETASQAPPVSS